MAKRAFSVRLDEDLVRQVRRYLSASSDSEAVQLALERARDEERERRFWRRWAGKGGPDAFRILVEERMERSKGR
jgi:Arc/MetJ family transcription regulator